MTYSALVPNLKGLERARAAGLSEAAVFISATETHSRKNINKSIAEALSVAGDVTRGALAAGMRVRAYLSVVWGCPYEGAVPLDRVVDLCRRLADMGIYQLSLGDTVGVGMPNQTEEILEALTAHVPVEKLALHLHDTRGARAGERAGGPVGRGDHLRREHRRARRLSRTRRARQGTSPPRTW